MGNSYSVIDGLVHFFCSKNSDIVISFCTYVDFDQADDDTATTTTQDDDETGSGEHLTLSLLVIRLVTSSALQSQNACSFQSFSLAAAMRITIRN